MNKFVKDSTKIDVKFDDRNPSKSKTDQLLMLQYTDKGSKLWLHAQTPYIALYL